MTRLPRLTGRRLISALEKAGFTVIRVKGSHHYLRHSDGPRTVVPTHRGETIGPGLLSKILRDCEMTCDELTNFCKVIKESAVPGQRAGLQENAHSTSYNL